LLSLSPTQPVPTYLNLHSSRRDSSLVWK